MTYQRCGCESAPDGPTVGEPGGYGPEDDAKYAAYLAERNHDCPREAFLDDPMTVASGMGSEMVGLIACPVCDAEDD